MQCFEKERKEIISKTQILDKKCSERELELATQGMELQRSKETEINL